MPAFKAICLWSGPRNVSTALMYSFAQRSDTYAIDEPLYAHYLRVSGSEHPGRELVLESMNADGDAVMRKILGQHWDRPVVFMKQMAHHLVELDLSFLTETTNVFLIRDPEEVIPSLIQQVPDAGLNDVGLARQARLFDDLQRRGQRPAVIDARYLLMDPHAVLEQLCVQIDIPFEDAMLHWPPGPKREDGVWAPHWYANVHRSTGFIPYRKKENPVPDAFLPLLDQCRPYYEHLRQCAVRPSRRAS